MTTKVSFLKTLVSSACVAMACQAGVVHAVASATDSPSAELVARGQYLAAAGDCAACHTAPGGKLMGGGLAVESSFGTIYSSNISPSKSDGIGSYSEAEFARALREGVRADGTHLYPAMPYTSYAGISDEDVKALYAYFMHGVQPVDAAPPATHLAFPFNQRWLMGGWNLLFAGDASGAPVGGKSEAWNRGQYLVQTLGHCDACHTPRNFAMGEKRSLGLSGGSVGAWRAPNITSDPVSGIGGWSHEELVQYLRTGAVAGKAQAAGDMAEVVGRSTQYLSDTDLMAIATYLKDAQAVRNPDDKVPAYSYEGSGQNYEAALRAQNPGIGFNSPGPGYVSLTSGAQLYSANCASCHQSHGDGTADHAFPALTHNSVLGHDNADNLVMVMLGGLHIETQGSERQMPGFADDLNDEQIAALATFVMKQYGNPDVTVSAERVAQLRKGGAIPVTDAWPVGVGFVVSLLVLAAIVWGVRRKRAR